MAERVVVNGDTITFAPPNPAAEGVAFVMPVKATIVVVSGDKLTAEGEAVALLTDLTAMPPKTANYTSILFPVVGAGIITITGWNSISSTLKKGGLGACLADGEGTYIFIPGLPLPALNTLPTPIPDAVFPKVGTFTISPSTTKLKG